MASIVRDESRCQTIPCKALEEVTFSWINFIHRSKVALSDEIVRLEQEFARVSRRSRFSLKRQRVTILERTQIWASLLICRSLLLSLGKNIIWVEESTAKQQLEEQAMKRAARRS
jgi:hypothetical protein